MASVSLKQVCKTFGRTEVVHGVDVAIDDGEFVVLVGPSGCGKSTLLRMIAGLEEITAGEIHIGDLRVSELRALPAHDGIREHGVFDEAGRSRQAGTTSAG
jgi:sn-glycerol 3-phosphate transport system ATP-binding protein